MMTKLLKEQPAASKERQARKPQRSYGYTTDDHDSPKPNPCYLRLFADYNSFVDYNKNHLTAGVFVCRIVNNRIRLPRAHLQSCRMSSGNSVYIVGMLDHLVIAPYLPLETTVDCNDADAVLQLLETYGI